MAVLVLIYSIAFLFSAIVHFCTLLSLFDFSPGLQFVLKYLFGALLVLEIILLEKKRNETRKGQFAREFKDSIPEWMKTGMGLIFIYGIGMFLFSLGGAFSTASVTRNTEATVDKFNIGLSALIMTGYALAFCMIVVYKRIGVVSKKRSDGQND